jgi:hypothetical protein
MRVTSVSYPAVSDMSNANFTIVAQVPVDFDGDGKSDILWRRTPSGTVAIWLMDGLTISSVGAPGGAGSDWQMMNQ